ncbi:MAG: hypothetical protein J0M04_23755 [Verrucomicrobia bacterium]|nr:hypothetical protein [Verrucomicrobiota bacterium]
MTKDADLVVRLDAQGWSRLPSLLPDGIELEEQMGFEMVTATQRELLRVKGSFFQIELFRLSEDAHDRMRFDRRIRQTIFPGVEVALPTAEDVIIQKLRWSRGAKRPKDFTDTVAVMQVQGISLDWPYIEHWCALHDTLDVLAEAKAEASVVWEADELENAAD